MINFLNSIRFSADLPQNADLRDSDDELLKLLLHRAVRVNADIFPRLAKIIETVFVRLNQDSTLAEFFVYPSTEIQASCVRTEFLKKPTFLISSSLINYFNDDEIAFVIGHEFGHFFFSHSTVKDVGTTISVLRKNILERATEISADRVGLLACEKLVSAISSLIKLATGLTEKDVKLNINVFLRQYNELLSRGANEHEAMSSHPMFLIRLRSLLLFSRTREYAKFFRNDEYNLISLEEVDGILRKDFIRLSGLSLLELENSIVRETTLMGLFLIFASDSKFSKDEQRFLKDIIGEVDTREITQMLKEKGITFLEFEFDKNLSYIVNSSFSKTEKEKMFSILESAINTFPSDDTLMLRQKLNNIKR